MKGKGKNNAVAEEDAMDDEEDDEDEEEDFSNIHDIADFVAIMEADNKKAKRVSIVMIFI